MSSIEIHFDGDFASNHQISMRNLSRSLTCLQGAINRAHLDNTRGNVWKYARMTGADYEATEFFVQAPEEGGYILDFISAVDGAGRNIVNRLKSSLLPAYNQATQDGEIEIIQYKNKIVERKAQLQQASFQVESYREILQQPTTQMIRRYGDRSIAKEIDQMLSPVRANGQENNLIQLTLSGEEVTSLEFNRANSRRFHLIVSQRDLGIPISYRTTVRSLDNLALKGKVYNLDSRKEASIYFDNPEDFLKVYPFLARRDEEMRFVGAPVIEYGAFDPDAGDIYFLDLIP